MYRGITNAGGEESILRYSSTVSEYKSLNLKRSYIVIQGGVSQYKTMELNEKLYRNIILLYRNIIHLVVVEL